MLVHERVSTQDTLACEHIFSRQGTQFGRLISRLFFLKCLTVIRYVSKRSVIARISFSYSKRQSSTMLSMTWVISMHPNKQRGYIVVFCEKAQEKSQCFCISTSLLRLTHSILPQIVFFLLGGIRSVPRGLGMYVMNIKSFCLFRILEEANEKLFPLLLRKLLHKS